MKRIICFIFIIFFIINIVSAADFNFNTINTLYIHTISGSHTFEISGFPQDWQYNTIVLQLNSKTTEQFDVDIQVKGTTYHLSGWTDQIDIPYAGETVIPGSLVTSLAGIISVSWWAENKSGSPGPGFLR